MAASATRGVRYRGKGLGGAKVRVSPRLVSCTVWVVSLLPREAEVPLGIGQVRPHGVEGGSLS